MLPLYRHILFFHQIECDRSGLSEHSLSNQCLCTLAEGLKKNAGTASTQVKKSATALLHPSVRSNCGIHNLSTPLHHYTSWTCPRFMVEGLRESSDPANSCTLPNHFKRLCSQETENWNATVSLSGFGCELLTPHCASQGSQAKLSSSRPETLSRLALHQDTLPIISSEPVRNGNFILSPPRWDGIQQWYSDTTGSWEHGARTSTFPLRPEVQGHISKTGHRVSFMTHVGRCFPCISTAHVLGREPEEKCSKVKLRLSPGPILQIKSSWHGSRGHHAEF